MNDTTHIHGEADLLACMKRAGCLIFDVYDKKNAEMPANMRHLLAEVNNWEKVFDNRDDRSGYRAVLYKRKGSDADRERGALCPPVLVFRGSDFTEEEFAGIALSIEIDYELGVTVANIPTGLNSQRRFEYVFGINPAVKAMTVAELKANGFQLTDLIQNDSGSAHMPLRVGMVPTGISVPWTASIGLWTKDQGDWATNVRQGLGQRTTQYDDYAVRDALQAAEYAMNEWDGKLMILGHSLGGGLASLATCVAQRAYHQLNIRSNVYNAAGVNPATAQRAGTALSAGVVLDYVVEDEILTTLQKTPNCPIPLVDSIFRWAGKRMYPHHSLLYEDRASSMEDLWPVPESGFRFTNGAHRVAQRSATLSQFVENMLEEFWIPGAAYQGYREYPGLLQRATRSAEYHYMTSIAETYPYHITA